MRSGLSISSSAFPIRSSGCRQRISHLGAAFLTALLVVTGCSRSAPVHPLVSAKNGNITIPLAEVRDGTVHFYTFKAGGRQTNFFVRTDRNGRISACFDACFTCYKQKKGYAVQGTDLVCRECDMHFGAADEHWDNSKGCSPILLKSRIEGDSLVIDADLLVTGQKLFP